MAKTKTLTPTASAVKSPEEAVHAVIIVRHGTTDLNGEGRIRGWMDVPLSSKGIEESVQAANDLSDEGIEVIFSSDLRRAMQTAEAISKTADVPVEETDVLRPWNLGELTGHDVEKTLSEVRRYVENPDETVPGGESFDAFRGRFLTGFLDLLRGNEGKRIAVVTHHRGERLLAAWENAGYSGDLSVDEDEFLQPGIEPGDWREQDIPDEVVGDEEEE